MVLKRAEICNLLSRIIKFKFTDARLYVID